MVAMDAGEYEEKITNLLKDPVYKKVKRDPAEAIERKVLKEVRELEKLSLKLSEPGSNHLAVDHRNYMAYQNTQARGSAMSNSVLHWFNDIATNLQTHHKPDYSPGWTFLSL